MSDAVHPTRNHALGCCVFVGFCFLFVLAFHLESWESWHLNSWQLLILVIAIMAGIIIVGRCHKPQRHTIRDLKDAAGCS